MRRWGTSHQPWAGRGSLLMARAGRPPHDWLSADWRWGYGVGAAHDAAAELRARLRSRAARAEWAGRFAREDGPPWDEALLALALKIQRAGNYRRIDWNAGFGAVLNDQAAGSFGSGSQPDAGLVAALEEALVAAGANAPAGGQDAALAAVPGDRARDALLKSLNALDFIDDGL